MNNMKFYVKDEEQSAQLQHILFAYGYDWEYEDYKGVAQTLDGYDFLYADSGEMAIYKQVVGANMRNYTELDTEAYIAAHAKFNTSKEMPLEAPEAAALSLGKAPWVENTGEMPVDADTRVDILMGEALNAGGDAGGRRWSINGSVGDITKWRFHNIEDYYTYPKTNYVAPEYQKPVDYSTAVGIPPRNKYSREIKPGVFVDVYDVLRAFQVADGALAHLVKKALAVGQRGHKDALEDYEDIVKSAERALEIHKEWE